MVSLRVPHSLWADIVREAKKRGSTRTEEMVRRLQGPRGHQRVEAEVMAANTVSSPVCAHLKVKVLSYGVFCADCGAKVR
jgi:hypothetical protein